MKKVKYIKDHHHTKGYICFMDEAQIAKLKGIVKEVKTIEKKK